MDNKEQIMKDFNDIDSNQSSLDDNLDTKKKRGFNIWKFLLIVCFLLIIGGFVYYFVFALKPKAVLANGVGKLTNSLYKIVEPLNVDYKVPDNFSINNNTKISYNGEDQNVQSLFNGIDINTKYMYSKTDKKMYLDMDSNLSSSKLNANYYVNKNEQYLFLEDIFDKYVKMEDLSTDIFSSIKISKDDITYIYNKLLSILDKNIKDEWISREIKFSTDPTVIATLKLDGKQYLEVLTDVKNELLSDAKVIEILSTISPTIVDSLKEQQIVVDVNSFSLKVEQSIIRDNLKNIEMVVTDSNNTYKYTVVKDGNKFTMSSFVGDQKQGDIIFTIDGKNMDIGINSYNENIATFALREENGYYNYFLSFVGSEITGGDVNKIIQLSYRFKYDVSTNLNYDTSIGFKYMGLDFTLNNVGTISSLNEQINVDTSDYILYTDIDSTEANNKLNEKLNPFIQEIYSILGTAGETSA